MNENENNVTELQNDVQPEVTPEVATVEMPNPEPVADPVPVVTPPATTPVEPPKKNNKTLIIVLIVVLLLGVGAWYVYTQTDLFEQNTKEDSKKSDKKKDKDKDKDKDKEDEKDDDEDYEEMDDEELKKYNGVYTFGENTIKLYPTKSGTVFYNINDAMHGFAVNTGDSVTDNSWGEKLSFTLDGTNMKVKSSEYPEYDGTYARKSDYSQEDLINDAYSEDGLFNSSYNGHYTLKDDDMYVFQSRKDTVRVIILAKEFGGSFDVEFDIVDETTITEDFFDDVYTIKFTGDSAVFSTEGEGKEHDGTYKKVGSVDIEELLEFGLY